MIVLTSFSPKGYELYGKRFLESFVENWPCKVIVYHEGQPDFQHEKVIYKPLDDVFGYQAFIQYCNRNPVFSGQTPMGYNYNYDAAKFCKKVFAQFDALKNNKGKAIWLDGDTFTKEPVTEEWVNDLFDDTAVSYLARAGFHCESGYVGFDTAHREFQEFFERYENVYRRGHIFKLKRWHDCEALDWAIAQSNVKVKNLSEFFKIPPDRKMDLEDLDVFGKSVLGQKMEHLKGSRKRDNKLH